MARSRGRVLQLKVTLDDVAPPIWRRFLVDGDDDLARLHEVLQVVMGWTDSHLHMFVAKGRSYGEPDPDFDDDVIPENGVRIDTLLRRKGDALRYEYDFGDGWEHEVLLEDVLDEAADQTAPRCLAGARACPPEDVGGVPGYEDFLAAHADADHPEHGDMVLWAGEGFDPEGFDVGEVNALLAAQ